VAGTLRVAVQEPGDTVRGAALSVGTCEAALDVRAEGGQWVLEGEVRVPDAERWWPHTHGGQPRYPVTARIALATGEVPVELTPVGFRTVELDRGQDGRGFALRLNGRRVFCRGACWTPLDVASLGADAAAYRDALETVRRAGMNMVRVGGTMVYEADVFHDLCDELGIL